MNSHNHIMFGAIDGWFFNTLGGFQHDPSSTDYGHFLIRPLIPNDSQICFYIARNCSGNIEVGVEEEQRKWKRILTIIR